MGGALLFTRHTMSFLRLRLELQFFWRERVDIADVLEACVGVVDGMEGD